MRRANGDARIARELLHNDGVLHRIVRGAMGPSSKRVRASSIPPSQSDQGSIERNSERAKPRPRRASHTRRAETPLNARHTTAANRATHDPRHGSSGFATPFHAMYKSRTMPEIPLKRWGKVTASSSLRATEVRIEPAAGGAYLILLREGGSEFDEWCESMADVERRLDDSTIDWQLDVTSKP